jgi:hypothetical protein
MDPVHSLVQEKIHAMFGIQDWNHSELQGDRQILYHTYEQ